MMWQDSRKRILLWGMLGVLMLPVGGYRAL